MAIISPHTGEEDNDILTGLLEQDGGLWVLLGVDLGSMCGWLMLLLFSLLFLLLLCLIWRRTVREQRENVQENGRIGGKKNGS